jgi:hypothetical protein
LKAINRIERERELEMKMRLHKLVESIGKNKLMEGEELDSIFYVFVVVFHIFFCQLVFFLHLPTPLAR